MGTEQDIADLQDTISALVNIILDEQVALRALENALVDHHGLSRDVLRSHRVQMKEKQEALRAGLDSATRKIARLREPPQ
jgi:hypothetical protein